MWLLTHLAEQVVGDCHLSAVSPCSAGTIETLEQSPQARVALTLIHRAMLDGDDRTPIAAGAQSGSHESALQKDGSVWSGLTDASRVVAGMAQDVSSAFESEVDIRNSISRQSGGQRLRTGHKYNPRGGTERAKALGELGSDDLGTADVSVPKNERNTGMTVVTFAGIHVR
jgi:hypothetical protein